MFAIPSANNKGLEATRRIQDETLLFPFPFSVDGDHNLRLSEAMLHHLFNNWNASRRGLGPGHEWIARVSINDQIIGFSA